MTTNAEDYIYRLRSDIKSLQTAIDIAVDAAPADQGAIDKIYALLHNTKTQGEVFQSGLVTSICALACGILQRSRSPNDGTWRAIKAHVDALAIVVEHDLAGDGGPLGQRLVDELKGLAKAVGA